MLADNSKGGIVLWCYTLQGVRSNFADPINALIKSVILQGKGGKGTSEMMYNQWKMKSKMDNEFELVFVVGYQKALSLMYVDKLIDDVHLSFRDQYRQKLLNGSLALLSTKFDYGTTFAKKLKDAEAKPKETKIMRTFAQSGKSQKNVGSMIVDKNKKDQENNSKPPSKGSPKVVKENGQAPAKGSPKPVSGTESPEVIRKREEYLQKMAKSGKGAAAAKKTIRDKNKGKAPTKWDKGGNSNDMVNLDFSKSDKPATNGNAAMEEDVSEEQRAWVNKSSEIKGVDFDSDTSDEDEENSDNKKQSGGLFSMFRGLVGSNALTKDALQPALSKMNDHLITKNVAADIAEKMCDSVSNKLEGKVLGTFTTIASTVKQSLQDSLVQILTPKRRVDILRDVLESQRAGRPYAITFCGVNGVGKSTNLAKICFWLMENGFRVLIAACDTFRAGAVEQLVTHTARLRALHPPSMHGGKENVLLFQKGYGKDAAGIAMQAIKTAQEQHFDVVLIDTAGRMQDNEPLMRALAKLITINLPDLVLFVGEALVGNEAVDQLVKFNQALADYSKEENPRLIDGIVLTKFDTIDDKVGAAISMTYTTGQPIVFVGTGQSYPDLRSLNAKAVVHALLK